MELSDKITVQIDHYDSTDRGCSSELTHSEEYTGTVLDAFERVASANETLRYCNGCYVKFADPNIQKAYLNWRKGLSYTEWLDVVGMTYANTD